MKWTSEQEKIFAEYQHGTTHARVLARAGSGKSSTINQGLNLAPENKILYSVFNKKLATEAQGKIKNSKVEIKTLHALGFSYLLKNWRKVRAGSSTEYFRIKEISPDMPAQVMFRTAQLVSYLKNTLINPTLEEAIKTANLRGIDAGKDDAAWPVKSLAEIALKSIEKSKNYSFNISFEDMLYLPLVNGWISPSYEMISVDEVQDMSLVQLEMITRACLPSGRMILVGDDRQQIYGFRGALSNGMDKFKEKLNTKEFTLTTSFRCPKKVISFVQAYVPDIKATDNAIDGEVNTLNEEKFYATVKPLDSVLSRTNAPLMKQCLTLIRKSIPAYIEGKDFAKTLIDLIKDIGGNNVIEFLDKLQKWQDIQIVKYAGKSYAGNTLDLIQDKCETLRVLSESCLTMADMEKKINSLFYDADMVKVPSVVLSTVHKAKGLEWANVFVLQDSFSNRKGLTPEEIQEEINIKYVCFTRAKKTLNLVSLNNGGKPIKKTNSVNPAQNKVQNNPLQS